MQRGAASRPGAETACAIYVRNTPGDVNGILTFLEW